jgi:hypothetical protein
MHRRRPKTCADSAIHRCWTARLLYPDEQTFKALMSSSESGQCTKSLRDRGLREPTCPSARVEIAYSKGCVLP